MAITLGKDAKLYRNSGTYSSPTWNLVSNVRDLTLNLETGEADVTTRGNNGWRATVATLKDASVEFEMVWDSEDLNFIAIRNAFLSNQPLELLVLDGIVISFTNQGLRATCMITGFSRNEPLEEAITVNVSAKPTYAGNPPTWYNVDP
jgi:hypothetical protein